MSCTSMVHVLHILFAFVAMRIIMYDLCLSIILYLLTVKLLLNYNINYWLMYLMGWQCRSLAAAPYFDQSLI